MAEGQVAGRYTIEAELGRGASATVYRARDTLLERPVALKVISSSLASDPEFTFRFEQEARLAARLDHPNIVTVYDVGTQDDGRAFIAMRLLQGMPLDRLMAERGALPAADVARIVAQLAAALDYTHAAGLVHRDVKPSNVTIDEQQRVTLTDFGIARALDSARVTLPGLTIGTPRYMSPEQVRGADTAPATDEYSLAVMAYEMLAGRPPFEGDGTALMYQIVHEEAPAPTEFNPAISDEAASVLATGLAKEPGARWPSCGEFARQLAAALTAEAAAGPTISHDAPGAAPTILQPTQLATHAATITPASTVIASAPLATTAPHTEAPAARTNTANSPEYLTRGAALTWAAAAALFVGGAALAVFVLLGGGDGEGRFHPDAAPSPSGESE